LGFKTLIGINSQHDKKKKKKKKKKRKKKKKKKRRRRRRRKKKKKKKKKKKSWKNNATNQIHQFHPYSCKCHKYQSYSYGLRRQIVSSLLLHT
jgi:hypothetical protein